MNIIAIIMMINVTITPIITSIILTSFVAGVISSLDHHFQEYK